MGEIHRKRTRDNIKQKMRIGATQQKILLLLATGVALGFSGSPKQYFKILRACRNDWESINSKHFSSSVSTLRDNDLITYKKRGRSGVFIHLTEKGKQEAHKHKLHALEIKRPARWDKKWRIVAFDVPEELSSRRDALRYQLKRLGFVELQKSVFVHPFPAQKEIEEVARFYNINKYITYIRADQIVGDKKLRSHFNL